ncbi:haloacid dehalogenase [Lentinula detonsa]|uniref:Haloacid dehalogenase n=1 Tax=Lentinula detonsa TaxID=2804962 RepID=A0A9W8NSY8_9AGAR|nr:haloacid dehalogenase [Lentinula detonsa]
MTGQGQVPEASEFNNEALRGVEVLIFDVFGTVVDWRGSVTRELEQLGRRYGLSDTTQNWIEFANEWRKGYMENTRRIAQGGEGSLNVDVMHREGSATTYHILDKMLSSQWSHVGNVLNEEARVNLNLIWHRLDGWPDTLPGLRALKTKYVNDGHNLLEAKPIILATLSNGNMRLLVDMAKHAQLPWDVIFSSALFGSFKPNPKTYLSALSHLSISSTPHKAAMVAAHLFDLQAAKGVGMRTIYVRRPREDEDLSVKEGRKEGVREEVKSKAEGGVVDVVVEDFMELARLFRP